MVTSAELNPPAVRVLIPPALLQEAVRPAPAHARLLRFAGDTMGTTWSVLCLDAETRPEPTIHAAIVAVLDQVVRQMSNWRGDSDISRFNQAAAGEWVTLPADCFHVVDTALRIARLSGGAYDPTAAALVNLWGFGPAPRRDSAPALTEILRVRAFCGWARIELDAATRRIRQPGGVALDLCAIAKGFAVDAVSARLGESGLSHHLVEIGGELRGAGIKPDGLPWWVDLEAPPLEDDAKPQTALQQDRIALHELAVATSGDYRRYFIDRVQRQRYAHTIDPRTGYPASHALASVTVIHAQCMLADAWSTALTVLGPQAGLAVAERHHLAVRFILRTPTGFRETCSAAWAAMLE
ncbi:FAD:protein FMN transferase [Silvimonas iriomotensis]|uniref:FAD:protein FMN transferase n=1 Tax=Silvimonas iriomotensis TaxID=449662 RepID=A0ABQ2P990_9NEIS|nr:FAD:protein FMN transferase [Silvimonas iriomotensis]GGP21068.1 FAD:protein FMN transferase [Silvimonas iriomotensis]